jgi:energy-converting hydrogenase Eha subunit G
MIPAVIWWASRNTYWSKAAWRTIGALIAFIWVWDQAVFYYAGAARSLGLITAGTPIFSLVGPALGLWVLLEAFDIRAGLRAGRAAEQHMA